MYIPCMRAAFFDLTVGKHSGKAVFVLINENLLEIIRADKNARLRAERTADESGRIGERLEKARTELEKEYAKRADDIIAHSFAEKEESFTEAKERCRIRLDEAEKEIARLYERKKNDWVNGLVEEVIGECVSQ